MNWCPLSIDKLSGVEPATEGLFTVKSKTAFDAVLDEGVYPNSLALDTTFFLICAVSKNISDATMFALNAEVCAEYANKSINIDKLEPSKS